VYLKITQHNSTGYFLWGLPALGLVLEMVSNQTFFYLWIELHSNVLVIKIKKKLTVRERLILFYITTKNTI